MLKLWPWVDSSTTSRGPLPPTSHHYSLGPFSHLHRPTYSLPSVGSALLIKPVAGYHSHVLLLLPWASPDRVYSLTSCCPDSMVWLPDPLLYGLFSAWDLNLMTWNPIHLQPSCLYLPTLLQAQSTALAFITYLLASSPSDKRPFLDPLG